MFASLLGIALAVAPAIVPQSSTSVAPVAPPPAAEEIFAIPPPLREALQTQVVRKGGYSEQQRLTALARFLFDPSGLGMTYQHDADYTVAEAYQTRKANCLTFTLLTIALAREIGIEAHGQEIPRVLAWYREGDTLYFSNHVNAGILAGGSRYTVDVASDSILSGDPPKRIADRRLLAIFYSNRAAGLLGHGQLAAAGQYMSAAFEADGEYPAAWNNAGVLALREGRRDDAERHFLRTLELSNTHEGALMNLAALYAARGDLARERQLRKRIDGIQRRNPFHHFLLATEHEKQGDYVAAARRYRRAIALFDGEHEFHHGLARAYLHLGEYRKAGEALRHAQAVASKSAARRYQAKLDLLRRKGL
ncbi:tetratricopeptide repeat protein [Luteimonas sp. SDU101]|uniref:tetratricopeptide repeat protein n=1 Tax=Luteimonas sp. SDU101 TaxID=3422593 RepID=UPI003EBCD444